MKSSILTASVLALALSANAQGIEGMGWDAGADEAVVRLGLGGYAKVEVGLGLRVDATADNGPGGSDDEVTSFSLSGRYLHALHSWEKLTGYLHAAVFFRDDSGNPAGTGAPFLGGSDNKAGLAVFLGYQPELVLVEHLAVAVNFGLAMPLMPDFKLAVTGDPVSIVSGFNFRILF